MSDQYADHPSGQQGDDHVNDDAGNDFGQSPAPTGGYGQQPLGGTYGGGGWSDPAKDQTYGKVTGEQNPFERILSKIPGFSGYMERQNRRDADKIMRTTLANRFEELGQRAASIQRDFISQGEIGMVDDMEAAAIKMRTFSDRIRRAARGYSGLFDAVLIGQEELAQLYEYDAQMLELVDEISRAMDNVEASVGSDGLPASIRHLTKLAQQAIDAYNHRSELVFGTPQG